MNFDIMYQRLKEQRIKNELSQQNVSKAIGITQSHYALIKMVVILYQ